MPASDAPPEKGWPLWASRTAAILGGLAMGALLLETAARTAQRIGFATAESIDNEPRDRRPVQDLFVSEPPVKRVLVLGDSMAYAPGVGRNAVWTTRLEALLNEHHHPTEVVNLGRGGDNTYGQLQILREALAYQPVDLVLLLYNHNDVYGSRNRLEPRPPGTMDTASTDPLASKDAPDTGTKPRVEPPPVRHADPRRTSVARAARWLRHRSHYSVVALARVGMQLRAWGILVPGTEFHHLARRSYRPDSPGWLAVQEELVVMQRLADESSTRFAIYVLPQFASLRHDFFRNVRRQLATLAEDMGTPIGFGYPSFEGGSWRTYAMSPFDGHPNEYANQRIAEVILEWVVDNELLPSSASGPE